jgi:hypothetical protein
MLDINGYTLSNVAGDLKLGASNTRIIAANYGISDPMLPGMLGSVTDGSSAYKVYPYPLNDVNLNNGSPYSYYRFTCPATGIYYTSFAAIVGTGVSMQGYFGIIVNGGLWYFSYRDSAAIWELHHVEMQLKLSAGDYIEWAANAAPGPDSSTAGGAYRANHNHCTVWLVG